MDGYPDGEVEPLFRLDSADKFREAVTRFIAERDDGTAPDRGWPWPWDDSGATDFAYAFDDGKVWTSGYGGEWHHWPTLNNLKGAERDAAFDALASDVAVFPDMKLRKAVTMGKRSGLVVLATR